jgi:hypothetical protein
MTRGVGLPTGARLAGIRALAIAVAICGCSAGAARATQSASLRVSLSPNRLGASTTISFGFQIGASGHGLPPALRLLNVRLPSGMGVDTAGVATCAQSALAHGPRGCPSGSRVGSGSVRVKVPLGDVVRLETATLTVFNAPRKHGHTTLLFYAAGRVPIATQLVFSGVIVPGPLGQTIEASIPLIPTLPEAPDAAIVAMSSTLGTRQLTYYRTIGHRRVRFTPKGATIPAICPVGGFPFAANFGFNDASDTTASTTVACPR